MFCDVDEAKRFKETSDELVKRVKDNLPKECSPRYMECIEFEVGDKSYALCSVAEDDVISEGKYENGGTAYQLIEFDKSIASYPCTKSITNEYNLLVYVGFSRCGSYFSDWEYEYCEPLLQQITIETVPEQIILEHDELVIEYL